MHHNLDGVSARRLLDGDSRVVPCVVQVLTLRRVELKQGGERFVAHVSDGTHVVGAVFASQVNDVVGRGDVRRYSMVEVTDFTTCAQGAGAARVCVLVRVRVVGVAAAVVGSPRSLRRFGQVPVPPRAAPRSARRTSIPTTRAPPVVGRAWWVPKPRAPPRAATRPKRPPLVGGSKFFGTHGRWLQSIEAAKTKPRPARQGPRRRRAVTRRVRAVAGQRHTLLDFFST